jgi:hypothetical protein
MGVTDTLRAGHPVFDCGVTSVRPLHDLALSTYWIRPTTTVTTRATK